MCFNNFRHERRSPSSSSPSGSLLFGEAIDSAPEERLSPLFDVIAGSAPLPVPFAVQSGSLNSLLKWGHPRPFPCIDQLDTSLGRIVVPDDLQGAATSPPRTWFLLAQIRVSAMCPSCQSKGTVLFRSRMYSRLSKTLCVWRKGSRQQAHWIIKVTEDHFIELPIGPGAGKDFVKRGASLMCGYYRLHYFW